MNWLEPTRVLPLAGYPAEAPEAGSPEEAAVAFAEQQIEAATGAVWGAATDFTERFTLTAKKLYLETPPDTRTVRSVEPLPSGHKVSLAELGLALLEDGFETPWPVGRYIVRGSRGYTHVPEDVVKAASLLVGYYLDLSDPDRSRYTGLSSGDFAGSMRLSEVPVPEARALLNKYRRRVRVG